MNPIASHVIRDLYFPSMEGHQRANADQTVVAKNAHTERPGVVSRFKGWLQQRRHQENLSRLHHMANELERSSPSFANDIRAAVARSMEG